MRNRGSCWDLLTWATSFLTAELSTTCSLLPLASNDHLSSFSYLQTTTSHHSLTFKRPPLIILLASNDHLSSFSYLQTTASHHSLSFKRPPLIILLPSSFHISYLQTTGSHHHSLTFRQPALIILLPSDDRLSPFSYLQTTSSLHSFTFRLLAAQSSDCILFT